MLKHVFQTLGSRVVSAVLNFCTIIILSRYLGAAGKGEASVFITYVSFMVILSEFVGGSTLVYLVPRYRLTSLLVPSILWSLLTATMFSVFVYFFEEDSNIPLITLFLAGFFASLISIFQKVLSSFEKFEILSILNILQAVLIVALLLFSFEVLGTARSVYYAFSLIISYATIIVLSVVKLAKLNINTHLPKAGFKELVTLGFTNQIAHVFQLISTRYAFIVIDKQLGSFQTGIFSNAVQIAEAVWLITNSFASVQYAKIANQINKSESAELTNVLGRITLYLSFIALTIANVLPASFYATVFGADFQGIKQPLLILSVGSIFFNLMLIYGNYFSGQGIYYYNTLSVLLSSCVAILLFYVMRNKSDIVVASWITSLSYMVSGVLIFVIYCIKSGQGPSILLFKLRDLNKLKKLI